MRLCAPLSARWARWKSCWPDREPDRLDAVYGRLKAAGVEVYSEGGIVQLMDGTRSVVVRDPDVSAFVELFENGAIAAALSGLKGERMRRQTTAAFPQEVRGAASFARRGLRTRSPGIIPPLPVSLLLRLDGCVLTLQFLHDGPGPAELIVNPGIGIPAVASGDFQV